MIKTLVGIFLLLLSLGIPLHALLPSDNSATILAAQDGVGTVWGLSTDPNTNGTLIRWQAGNWVTQTVPGAAGLRPRVMTRGDDGYVYVLWQTPNQDPNQTPQCLVTMHRGVYSRILARFLGSVARDYPVPNTPTIFAGSAGDVWIAGYEPLLRRIASDGTVAEFPIKPEQCFGRKLSTDNPPQSIGSVADGSGRRWFWLNKAENWWQDSGLRGVLIWNGKTLDYHPTLTGLPDLPFSSLEPLDKNHFWLTMPGDNVSKGQLVHGALYRVDTRTLAAVRETPPRQGAFQNIAQIFQANGDWYIVEQTQNYSTASLWRRHAGRWQRFLDTLQPIGGYHSADPRHPWLSEPSGTWLGVSGGAWWLPQSGAPAIWVDWHRGLLSTSAQGLFPLPSSRILVFGEQGTAEMASIPQPIRPLPPGLVTGGMSAPKYLGPLLADPRHHLWGTRTSYPEPCPLDEWNGTQWRTHLPPKSIPGVGGIYACDTLGRLWLSTTNWNPPTQAQPVYSYAVYDPTRDTWTSYATTQDALQAAALLPSMAFLPYRNNVQPPAFSGNGRVTYTDNSAVYLYDGKAWRHWIAHDILPTSLYAYLNGLPRFNAAGNLEVTLNTDTYEWKPDAGWQREGAQKSEKYTDPMPVGGPKGLWATPVVDDLGRKWFVWHGAVYMSWHGLWTKPNALAAAGSPFKLGYGIEDALHDPTGHIFFVSRPAGFYDIVVWTPPVAASPPAPQIHVTPLAIGTVRLRFTAAVHDLHWFLWRLNGGEWSTPQKSDTALLTALPNGQYHVEAQTLDTLLQASPKYSAAVFVIEPASAMQIARWVQALLSGTEDAREAAVAGLVRQPNDALPALRAAYPTASENGRWWLDAAIQQINKGVLPDSNIETSQQSAQ